MKKNNNIHYNAVVMGVSTGGVSALKIVLGALPTDFPIPILVVTHITPDSDNGLAVLLDTLCSIRVKEADEGENILKGTVYLAPANYHLLIEQDGILALSIDPPVNYARPSVDVLFESAADVYGNTVIGVIMTGAGSDGSRGLLQIKNSGGLTIVQNPANAEMNSMPLNALKLQKADYIVTLKEIPQLLLNLTRNKP